MRVLNIMARINFMKLINVNYLTPLASFYNYTDLGQFGMPNIFKGSDSSITQFNSNRFFSTESHGNVIFNDYFHYSLSQVFLDNYGGIIFSAIIFLVLYLLARVGSSFFKNPSSKIKKLLLKISQSLEKSVFLTLLVSRYLYLCASLLLNYAFLPLNGTYQQISFVFAVFYTVLLLFVMLLAICIAFYYGRTKAIVRPLKPFFGLIGLLCKDYHSRRFLGRIMTFWTLLSNLLIMVVLIFLLKWPIVQISFLLTLSVATIIVSTPKRLYKNVTTKINVIGTEIGFIIFDIILLALYCLEDSESASVYNSRLGLSWCAVGVHISIILLQIIMKLIDFIQERRRKKKAEEGQGLSAARQTEARGSRRPRITLNLNDDSNLFELQKMEIPQSQILNR